MVAQAHKNQSIEQKDYRFSRRDVKDFATGETHSLKSTFSAWKRFESLWLIKLSELTTDMKEIQEYAGE